MFWRNISPEFTKFLEYNEGLLNKDPNIDNLFNNVYTTTRKNLPVEESDYLNMRLLSNNINNLDDADAFFEKMASWRVDNSFIHEMSLNSFNSNPYLKEYLDSHVSIDDYGRLIYTTNKGSKQYVSVVSSELNNYYKDKLDVDNIVERNFEEVLDKPLKLPLSIYPLEAVRFSYSAVDRNVAIFLGSLKHQLEKDSSYYDIGDSIAFNSIKDQLDSVIQSALAVNYENVNYNGIDSLHKIIGYMSDISTLIKNFSIFYIYDNSLPKELFRHLYYFVPTGSVDDKKKAFISEWYKELNSAFEMLNKISGNNITSIQASQESREFDYNEDRGQELLRFDENGNLSSGEMNSLEFNDYFKTPNVNKEKDSIHPFTTDYEMTTLGSLKFSDVLTYTDAGDFGDQEDGYSREQMDFIHSTHVDGTSMSDGFWGEGGWQWMQDPEVYQKIDDSKDYTNQLVFAWKQTDDKIFNKLQPGMRTHKLLVELNNAPEKTLSRNELEHRLIGLYESINISLKRKWIEKVGRGVYKITPDGEFALHSIKDISTDRFKLGTSVVLLKDSVLVYPNREHEERKAKAGEKFILEGIFRNIRNADIYLKDYSTGDVCVLSIGGSDNQQGRNDNASEFIKEASYHNKDLFIFLDVPEKVDEEYDHIPDLKDDLHVTLLYLPVVRANEHSKERMINAFSNTAKSYTSLSCKTSGFATFNNEDKSQVVLIEALGISELHNDLYEDVIKSYGNAKRAYDFIPHMTLCDDKEKSNMKDFKEISWNSRSFFVRFGKDNIVYKISFGTGKITEIDYDKVVSSSSLKLSWKSEGVPNSSQMLEKINKDLFYDITHSFDTVGNQAYIDIFVISRERAYEVYNEEQTMHTNSKGYGGLVEDTSVPLHEFKNFYIAERELEDFGGGGIFDMIGELNDGSYEEIIVGMSENPLHGNITAGLTFDSVEYYEPGPEEMIKHEPTTRHENEDPVKYKTGPENMELIYERGLHQNVDNKEIDRPLTPYSSLKLRKL